MSVRDDIRALADECACKLKEKIDERVGDMDADDKSHFLFCHEYAVTQERELELQIAISLAQSVALCGHRQQRGLQSRYADF